MYLSNSVYCAAQFVFVLSPAMSRVWLWHDEHMTWKHFDIVALLLCTSLWSDESVFTGRHPRVWNTPRQTLFQNRTWQYNVCLSLAYSRILFALITKSHDALWCTRPNLYVPFGWRHTARLSETYSFICWWYAQSIPPMNLDALSMDLGAIWAFVVVKPVSPPEDKLCVQAAHGILPTPFGRTWALRDHLGHWAYSVSLRGGWTRKNVGLYVCGSMKCRVGTTDAILINIHFKK